MAAPAAAPGIFEFGSAFYNGNKLPVCEKIFCKGVNNILGLTNLVMPLSPPILAVKGLASTFHNAASFPGIIVNAADITSGVKAAAEAFSDGDTGEGLFQVGASASKVTSLWSDITDVLSVIDSHVTKVNSAVLDVFKQVAVLGLIFGSGWGIFENSKDIYNLSDAVNTTVEQRIAGVDPGNNNAPLAIDYQPVDDATKARVLQAEINLRMWKLAEKISYLVLAIVLTLATFTALAVPVWLILLANTATLVFGVGKYFIEEMYVKPVTKDIVVNRI